MMLWFSRFLFVGFISAALLVGASVDGQAQMPAQQQKAVSYPSLFLTQDQRQQISDVRNFRGAFYNSYMAELREQQKRDELQDALKAARAEQAQKVKPPPEKRYIHLQGILYSSPDEWVVWMNGQKITPDALPKEVIGFKVHETYVEMEWYDEYTNKVIPLRLRPMQRFHIDSRMFLPG